MSSNVPYKEGDLVTFRKKRKLADNTYGRDIVQHYFEDFQDLRSEDTSDPIMIMLKFIDSSAAGELVEVYCNGKTYIYPSYLLEKLI